MGRDRYYKQLVWVFMLLAWTSFAHAVIETYEFASEAEEARYHELTRVLRCPKCQNQNLDGSNSPIAQDLRRELARMINEGKTDDEVVDFMVARYGDFVLYDPPFNTTTALLWVAPAIFLLVGIGVLFLVRRSHSEPVLAGECDADESPTIPLPAQTMPAPAWRWYTLLACAVLLATGLVYSQLGAWKQVKITDLTRAMYSELTLAAREERQPDPVYAKELIEQLVPYVKKHPEELTMVYLLGSTYAHINDYEQAIPHYKNYLMAVPTDEEALTEYVHILYFAAGRQLTERVQFVVDRALTLNPNNVQVLALLARHAYEHGDTATALRYWDRLLALIPADSETAVVLRETMVHLRQEQAAAKKKSLKK